MLCTFLEDYTNGSGETSSASHIMCTFREHAVAWLVEALCYKPEGCGLEYRLGH
jgi:hypothetical protein